MTLEVVMNTKVLLLGAAAFVALLSLVADQKAANTNELMREKLDHAQSVLEGITMENFDLIAGNAAKLAALSQESVWRASDTPEYAEQSVLFRRNVQALRKAASEKSLDGAALAYTKMTFSCVECHKYLRNRKVADAAIDSKALFQARASAELK
jgi:hypothetical protein